MRQTTWFRSHEKVLTSVLYLTVGSLLVELTTLIDERVCGCESTYVLGTHGTSRAWQTTTTAAPLSSIRGRRGVDTTVVGRAVHSRQCRKLADSQEMLMSTFWFLSSFFTSHRRFGLILVSRGRVYPSAAVARAVLQIHKACDKCMRGPCPLTSFQDAWKGRGNAEGVGGGGAAYQERHTAGRLRARASRSNGPIAQLQAAISSRATSLHDVSDHHLFRLAQRCSVSFLGYHRIQNTLKMTALTSIRTTGAKIEIVNQLLLPHTVEFIEIDTIEKAYDAIKSMKVLNWLTRCEVPLSMSIDSRCACNRVSRRAHLRVSSHSRTRDRARARLPGLPGGVKSTRRAGSLLPVQIASHRCEPRRRYAQADQGTQ